MYLKYDVTNCISYIIDKLTDNGFNVRYTHPNLLFISWKHWIPSYVRSEIKKKTGMVVDGYGNKIDNNDKNNTNKNNDDPNTLMFKDKKIAQENNKKDNSNFKSIDTYKPSGNLIYNNNLLKKITDKL